MNKAIVVLTGTPEGKSKFDAVAKKSCWLWNSNPKNYLTKIAKDKFYWDGEKNEKYFQFIAEQFQLVNKYFGFEEIYIGDLIEKFTQNENEQMSLKSDNGEEQVFNNFLLVIHGLSKELTTKLKEDQGVFQLHISNRKLNTNIENHDYCLYDDDENFDEEVNRFINILMK